LDPATTFSDYLNNNFEESYQRPKAAKENTFSEFLNEQFTNKENVEWTHFQVYQNFNN